jgi:YesN/AraC family two-component response regulator
MQVFSLKFLRTFILLLLTVFITDTVYASSKMVADMIAGQQDSQSISKAASHAVHCQNMQAEQAHEKSNSHAGSQHCSHCIACFSMIVQEKLSLKTLQATPSVIPAFVKIYHAPFRAQPQKPPIV